MRNMDGLWRSLGSTDDGRKWAISALHPCEDALATPSGIPDHTQVPIVSPSFRNSTNIAMPAGLSDSSWDLQLVMLPSPEIDYIWRARANASTNWSAWTLVRPSTFPALASGLATTLGASGYSKYRFQGRGYTLHHIASATTNQGVVVAGQINAIAGPTTTVVSATPKAAGQIRDARYNPYTVPASSQELTQQDSLSVEWNAPNGIYMPLRFPDPVHNYVDAADGEVVVYDAGTTPPTQVPQSFFTVSSALSNGGPPVVNQIIDIPTPAFQTPVDVPGADSIGYGASNPGNLFAGVVFFLGLSPSASVQVKSRMHLECQVDTSGTAVQPFLHSSPILDRQAMDIVATIGQVQSHAYPAKFNDFGGILGSIWDAVKSVAKPILHPLIEGVSGIPVVGGLVQGLANKVGL
jgi:hypothetical protein